MRSHQFEHSADERPTSRIPFHPDIAAFLLVQDKLRAAVFSLSDEQLALIAAGGCVIGLDGECMAHVLLPSFSRGGLEVASAFAASVHLVSDKRRTSNSPASIRQALLDQNKNLAHQLLAQVDIAEWPPELIPRHKASRIKLLQQTAQLSLS